jgi:hypothetical protein
MRFKKASIDAAVKNITKPKKVELPHILIYFDENSLNEEFIRTLQSAN